MSSYLSSSNNNIHNPYANRTKRQRTTQNDTNRTQSTHHNRCVLLFDMDCFYAQCERVRLGLPMDVKLCLFQWNSVLAVTYPAREYGIKRGDSWDDVATKMKKGKTNSNESSSSNTTKNDHECYTIHLPILGHNDDEAADDDHEEHKNAQETYNEIGDVPDDSIEASYKRIFELSKEEQFKCQKTENGRRRFHQQGKACLERYRLASMRIFAVVLESLQKKVTQECGYSFVLERASIDEFYLDLTDYCYQRNQAKDFEGHAASEKTNEDDLWKEKTVVAGRKGSKTCISDIDTNDPLEIALNRASHISYWIRQDIWKILGFTMSAGISTNKTMAKLAASYGKPNGQAVLYPNNFPQVLSETKITKVRNFGGKLGKTVLKLLLQYQRNEQPWNKQQETDEDALDRLKSTATMGDLNQIPLPFLIQSQSLSSESANFVFFASQGVDHEQVKETSGALVKSITAFKSFTATKSHVEIFDRWLSLLANEIVERVARDTTRNKRYPKSCTLNYTYYTTPNGQRPSSSSSTKSTRSQRQSKSLRLRYPSEREGTKQQKSLCLLAQTKEKLIPIVKDHPLRGVGLSVSNFIASTVHHQAQEGTTSIQSFFSEQGTKEQRKSEKTEHFPRVSSSNKAVPVSLPTKVDTSGLKSSKIANSYQRLETATKKTIATLEDKDLDYARKLQASFDRENYVLSTASQRRKSVSNVKKNTQRIDSFFKKR